MIKIYHLPRCGKSRKALAFLEENKMPHEVVLYTQNPLSREALMALQSKLNIQASQWVRTQEVAYKATYPNFVLTEENCIEILEKHPEWMQRPIIETEDRAIIAREEGVLATFLQI
jgi:arsenate reductase